MIYKVSKITFTINDAEEAVRAKKAVTKLSKQIKIDEDSGKFYIYFSDYEIENMKKQYSLTPKVSFWGQMKAAFGI